MNDNENMQKSDKPLVSLEESLDRLWEALHKYDKIGTSLLNIESGLAHNMTSKADGEKRQELDGGLVDRIASLSDMLVHQSDYISDKVKGIKHQLFNERKPEPIKLESR